MNSNHLIRLSVALGVIAAIGCADGQRSSGDRAGKGKKMTKAFNPSTNLVNGKPSKTATVADDARAESALAAAESDLTKGTDLTEFPAGDYRLVGSVTIYKLQETNENVKAGLYVTYGTDANFTADTHDTIATGKFKSTVDKGLNLAIPTTLVSADRETKPTAEKLLFTQVKNSPTKIEIVESMRALTAADNDVQGITVGKAITNGRDQSLDGKLQATARVLKLNNDTDVRVIVLVEEAAADGRINKVNRNVYLTYRRTGDAPKPAAKGTTPGAQQANATPDQGGGDGQTLEIDPGAASATKTN